MVRLYNASCLEVLETMEDKSVDLIVTDPPYLMDYKGGRGKSKSWSGKVIHNDVDDEDGRQLIRDYFKECYRVLKDDTVMYSFCDWRRIDFFKQEFEKHFELKNIIVWNKNNHSMGDWKCAYAFKYEFILFGIKGNKKPLNNGFTRDVIDCKKVSAKEQVHSNQKPVELLKIFIENSSNEGDIVFDGFMGSGSCAEACIQLNRRFIGVELDKKHYDGVCERLNYKEGENDMYNVTKEEIEMYDNFKKEMEELYKKSNVTHKTIKEEILDGTYVWVDINENGHIIGEIQYDDYDVNIHLNKQLYECYKEDAINKLYNKIHKTA